MTKQLFVPERIKKGFEQKVNDKENNPNSENPEKLEPSA